MTPPQEAGLLARWAASRQCVIDDHMFTVISDGRLAGAFRLQLFTAPDARPVAIATWVPGDGVSLTNYAEKYAAEVWRRHLPDSPDPPIWIQVQYLNGLPGYSGSFSLVTFDKARPYVLAGPQWCPVSDTAVAGLVGSPVDRDRGQREELPRPQVPEPYPVYQVAWVGLLPGLKAWTADTLPARRRRGSASADR